MMVGEKWRVNWAQCSDAGLPLWWHFAPPNKADQFFREMFSTRLHVSVEVMVSRLLPKISGWQIDTTNLDAPIFARLKMSGHIGWGRRKWSILALQEVFFGYHAVVGDVAASPNVNKIFYFIFQSLLFFFIFDTTTWGLVWCMSIPKAMGFSG